MNNSLNAMRLILIILFGSYEIWAFRRKKSVVRKLLPMILIVIFALLILVAASFIGFASLYFIFAFLVIELSQIGAMLVVLIETCVTLFSNNRNPKKVMILAIVFIILVVIYYLGERVF